MALPTLLVDRSGAIVRVEPEARELLKVLPGRYRLHRAGGAVLLISDENAVTAAQPGETLALAGDIAAMPLLGLMNLLGQSRETGRVVVKSGDVERVTLLKTGDVASVGSNLPRDRMGEFLVRLGKIEEHQLAAAMDLAQQSGQRIGQCLVQLKLLQPHELWSCIQEQMTEIFAELCAWTSGSFVMYRVPAEHPFPQTPALSMQHLLLEAVRRADEMSVFRERIPNVNARLRRTARDAGEVSEEDSPAFGYFELMGQSGATVAEVATSLQVAEFTATRLCYQLLRSGLIEIVKETRPPGPPFKLAPADRERIDIFNLAFREIRDEMLRAGHGDVLVDGVRKYLADPNGAFADLFRYVDVDDSGALLVDPLVNNLAVLHGMGLDPATVLTDALNELTFFMLFQCGELLSPKADENLGRRVRLIHASLPSAVR
ncbi:MAG: hypothetical protein A2138_12455 [Deltaproteobacteria bacterium RBG_16_71_12]|nr:MAG: hypothetical protein A2138_12455 [Deltaproteobacteria bacterium RBG_16_71_12]